MLCDTQKSVIIVVLVSVVTGGVTVAVVVVVDFVRFCLILFEFFIFLN